MKTDSIFYQLFQTFPRCFFDLLNLHQELLNSERVWRFYLDELATIETVGILIETILVYKLPLVNRQEIEKMFSFSDLSETKVYQEALEEGKLVAKQNLILRQLNLKIGNISASIVAEVKQLTLTELDNLALALLDFSNLEDLQKWLNNRKQLSENRQ